MTMLTKDEILSDLADRLFYHHYKCYGYEDTVVPSLAIDKLGLDEEEIEIRIEGRTFNVGTVVWVDEEVDELVGCMFERNINFVGLDEPLAPRDFNRYGRGLVNELIRVLAILRHIELDTVDDDAYLRDIHRTLENVVRRTLNKGRPVNILISLRRGLIIDTGDSITYKYDTVHPIG